MAATQSGQRGGGSAFAGFVPWLVFGLVAKPSTWEWAAVAALIAAVILAVPRVRGATPRLLEVGTIGFFAGVAVLGLLLDRAAMDWLERYSQSLAFGALAAIVAATLPFVPFSEQYASEGPAPEERGGAGLRRTHMVVSAWWAATFALAAALAAYVEVTGADSEPLVWVVPVALVAAAFKLTERYAARADAPAGPPAG